MALYVTTLSPDICVGFWWVDNESGLYRIIFIKVIVSEDFVYLFPQDLLLCLYFSNFTHFKQTFHCG